MYCISILYSMRMRVEITNESCDRDRSGLEGFLKGLEHSWEA